MTGGGGGALVLAARGVWFGYARGEPVLKGLDFEAHGGEVVAVLGPMGSGKTTLLMVLAGLLPPWRGVVQVGGLPAGSPGARRLVGLLFQSPDDQLFNPTVEEEIAYALLSAGVPRGEALEAAREAARRLGIEGLLGKRPRRLSYGQRKLVALASILVYRPRVLLLDEPLSNLDAQAAERMLDAIRRHVEEGGLAVVATHDIDLVLEASTRTCLLLDGRLSCAETRRLLRSGLPRVPARRPVTLRALAALCRGDWGCVEEAVRRAASAPRQGRPA